MTDTRKVALAVAVVVVLALGAYVSLGQSQSSANRDRSSSSLSLPQAGTATGANGGIFQPNNMLSFFGNFSQMTVMTSYNDVANRVNGQSLLSYTVLGRTLVNSTNYYKIEFTEPGASTAVIAWFNQQGGIDRVDVLGGRNYTGPGAPFFAQIFTSAFSFLTVWSSNASLLAGLRETAASAQSIGPTQMTVTTYVLPQPTSTYINITAKMATIPGTNVKLAVSVYQESPDGSSSLFQVTSATRA